MFNDYETTLAHNYSSRTFWRYQEQVWKSQHDKTKQTTFLSKLMVAKFNGSIFFVSNFHHLWFCKIVGETFDAMSYACTLHMKKKFEVIMQPSFSTLVLFPNSFCKGALIKKNLCVQCNKYTSLLPRGCNKKLEHLNQIQVLNNFKMILIYLYFKVILLYHDGLQYAIGCNMFVMIWSNFNFFKPNMIHWLWVTLSLIRPCD